MNTAKLREKIKEEGNLPEHIAIIMDGNGRWAKQRLLPRVAGHREGINTVREITRVCGEIDIKYLTLYTFSAENWNRPKNEVSALMKLLLSTLRIEIKILNKNNVRLSAIGTIEELSTDARKEIEDGIELTKNNTGLNLILALSYGSRQEILCAVKKIAGKVQDGSMNPDSITLKTISSHFYGPNIPDPDLLIRTGGEFRLSNFLLWQIAYSELFVSSSFWPSFRENELLETVHEFQLRERRFGKVSEQLLDKNEY